MKKILSIILICLMLPVTSFLLLGCDGDKDVRDFYKKYKNIGNATQNLHLVEIADTYDLSSISYKIDIDYSKSSTLSSLVENEASEYHYLKYFYQKLLDDSLSPVYFFGDTLSKKANVGNSKTNLLFKRLSNLKREYDDIDYYLGILITSLNATEDELINSSYLKKLYAQYEQAIVSACELSAIVSDIYFNNIVSNANINYSAMSYNDLTDADLSTITMHTRARLYYYKSIYANIYTQLYIRNSDLSEDLINDSATLPTYTPYSYVAGLKSIENKSIQSLRGLKQDIYTFAVSLYHIQKNIDTAYKHFIKATNKVAYLDLNENSTLTQVNYGKIISHFVNGIAYDSYEVISNLVSLLYM